MAMYKRYEGSFLSRSSNKWTCQIWQENTAAYTVGELVFPADSPLVIDWVETKKHKVICGSTATLKLISESDREYLDLYTIRPGTIRLDVLRNDTLYWSGCLDPEHSEEPYSRSKNYDVTLSFSDFGILKRLKYNLSGVQTMTAVLSDALSRSKINYTGINQSLISSYIGSSVLTLSALSVRSDNFYDEEEKPMTLHEAIEGMLQPLALRIVQKAGYVYVYDLNGAKASASRRLLQWASDDQVLGMDKVYNNVLVTFSPYAGKDAFEEFEYTGAHSEDLINDTASDPTATLGVECYSYRPQCLSSETRRSFTIFVSGSEGKGIASKLSAEQYYYIEPLQGGEQSEGLAIWFDAWNIAASSQTAVRKAYGSCPGVNATLFTGKKTYLPKLSSADAGKYRIRINTQMLLDARYNPFEDAGEYNEEENYASFEYIRLVAMPVTINLYDASGNVLAHYSNIDVINSQATSEMALSSMIGSWVSGAASTKDCWLFYYTAEDPLTTRVMTGWMSPRQAYNVKVGARAASVIEMDSGQYIPYPTQAGYIEMSVQAGIVLGGVANLPAMAVSGMDFRSVISDWPAIASSASKLRWFLLSELTMELVKNNYSLSDVDEEDIEYSGSINADAEEDLEINTICGTMDPIAPHARGLILKSSDSTPVATLTRASRTASPEQLLIGTMFSHHADRMDTLSGTITMGAGGLELLTDSHIAGQYLCVSESQNTIAEEAEIKAIKMIEDEYTD